MTNAYTVVCDILKQLGVPDQQLSPETGLTALGLESLHVLQMLFDLEKNYDITIPDEQLYTFETIGDLVTYLEA